MLQLRTWFTDRFGEVTSNTTIATPASTLDPETVAEVVCDRRRVLLLDYLADVPNHPTTAVDLNAVAKYVAMDEEGIDRPEALEADDWRRVYVSLYQTHIPKLVEWGVVEYDHDDGIVEPGPEAEAVFAARDAMQLIGNGQ